MARKRAQKERKHPPAAQDSARILHGSDLHLSAKRQWNADPVLGGLTETTCGCVNGGLAPDVTAITRETADQGRPEEYQEAVCLRPGFRSRETSDHVVEIRRIPYPLLLRGDDDPSDGSGLMQTSIDGAPGRFDQMRGDNV